MARGSTTGLLESRQKIKEQNTQAMLRALQELNSEKADTLWSYKDVWQRAGLKSPVALNSPWNRHIKTAVDGHNEELLNRQREDLHRSSGVSDIRDTYSQLRMQIKQLRAERDGALSRIAIFEADIEYYKKERRELLLINDRLRKRLSGFESVP